jgi:outer membrane biosynthesis protein TonB
MSDHNRGAYTPQSDAPLAFDARRAGGSRGPMPITLIFSALILLVLVIGGGIAILYHNGARKAGEPPQPVGEPVGAVRGPVESTAAPAGVQITNPPVGGPVSATPTFTPPPEQPAARPIETPPVASAPLPPPTATAPAVKTEAPPPAPKLAEAAPKTVAPTAKTAPAPPAPKTVAPAPKTAAAPAAKTTTSAGSMVQIGAFSSTALADAGWNEVARQMPGDMIGKTKVVEKVDRAGGAPLYRAMIGGFSSRAEAERLCLALLSKGKDCSVR